MFKYIYHISDLHINYIQNTDISKNNFKEISFAINQLIVQINNPEQSLIVITGDIFHFINKINGNILVFFEEIIQKLTQHCITIMIFGNHDVTPYNESNDIKIIFTQVIKKSNNRLFILSEEKEYEFDNIIFIPTLFYSETIKQPEHKDPNKTYISLYHNEINGCLMKSIKQFTSEIPDNCISKFRIKKSDFDNYDLVLLGHIHNHQFLQPNMAYPGSLLQTNFSEEINDQGYIKWDIQTKTGEFIQLPQNTGYITVTDKNYNTIEYLKNSYIRLVIYDTNKSSQEIQNYIQEKTNILYFTQVYQYSSIKSKFNNIQNKLILSSDTDLINIVSKELETNENQIEIIKLFTELLKEIHFTYNVSPKYFKLNELSFNNLMAYGKDNIIHFNNLNGIVGLVAPNHSGKSSIIDILLFSIYKKLLRGRSNDIINVKHLSESFNSTVNFNVNDTTYKITRVGQKINKSYQKKIQFDINNETQKIPTSEKAELEYIENQICPIDDFINSSIILQQDQGFLDLSPKDKRDNIFSIFNLDIFDDIMRLLFKYKKDTGLIVKDRKVSLNEFLEEHPEIMNNDKIYIIEDLEDLIQDLNRQINGLDNQITNNKSLIILQSDDTEMSDDIITEDQFIKMTDKIKTITHNIKVFKNKRTKQQELINSYLLNNHTTNDTFDFNISEEEYSKIPELITELENKKKELNDKITELSFKINSYQKSKYDLSDIELIDETKYNDIPRLLNEYQTSLVDYTDKLNGIKGYLSVNQPSNLIDMQISITKEDHINHLDELNRLKQELKQMEIEQLDYIKKYNEQHQFLNQRKTYLMSLIDDTIQDKYNNRIKIPDFQVPIINFDSISLYYNEHKEVIDNMENYIIIASTNNIDIKCKYCVMNNQDKLSKINKEILKLPIEQIINNMKICRHYIQLSKLIKITNQDLIKIDEHIIYYDYFEQLKIKELLKQVNQQIIKHEKNNKQYEYSAKINEIKERINALNELVDYYNHIVYFETLEQKKQIEDNINKINNNIVELNKMKDFYEYNQNHQLIKDKQLLINKINDIDKQIIDLKNMQQSYINQKYIELTKELDDINNQISSRKDKIDKLEKQKNRYIFERNKGINNIIEELKHQKLELSEQIKLNERRISYLEIYNKMNDDLIIYEKQLNYYTILEQLFKEQGLISNIISSLLKEIENEVNNTLDELAGFRISIDYDIKYGINIFRLIDNGKTKISANQMSGFEKEIVNIIFKIVLNKFNTKFTSDFLIIDEGFTSYDQNHLNNISQLMTLLKNNYRFVLIISHIDTLKDYFDKTIYIDTTSGDSKIIV